MLRPAGPAAAGGAGRDLVRDGHGRDHAQAGRRPLGHDGPGARAAQAAALRHHRRRRARRAVPAVRHRPARGLLAAHRHRPAARGHRGLAARAGGGAAGQAVPGRGRLLAAVRAGGKDYTLLAAGGRAGLAGWFLACAGSARDWPDELRESAAELAADVALERARLDAGRRGERRLGQQIISTVAGGAGAAEVGALLRAAGLPAEGRYVAVAAAAQAGGEAVPDLAGLVEELVLPVAARAAVGGDAAETLALVPLPGGGPARADPAGAAVPGRPGGLGPELSDPDLAARIREAEPLLAAGLRGGRLTAGISDAVTGSRELAAALREARGARRLAGLRSGPVCVVTGDEAGTHAMLLASVPADVLGSFRDRLIGPLLRYDRRRGAELVPTLSAFLACSGSWTACADRLHVHVNTLRYRIRRIEELTGRDLSSLDHRVDFVLALDAGPAGIRPGPAGEG